MLVWNTLFWMWNRSNTPKKIKIYCLKKFPWLILSLNKWIYFVLWRFSWIIRYNWCFQKKKLVSDSCLLMILDLVVFYKKIWMWPLSLKWHLKNYCSPSGCCAETVTVQGNFRQIYNFLLCMSAQVIVSAQNPP